MLRMLLPGYLNMQNMLGVGMTWDFTSKGVTVATDRLGSVRGNANGERMAYLPYGLERATPTTPDSREKFATYYRDPIVGADYADQRYYGYGITHPYYWPPGRFLSPDPGGISTADPKNPTSWNRYAYAETDPANANDPTGRIVCYDPDATSIFDASCTGNQNGGDAGGDGGGDPCGGTYFAPSPTTGRTVTEPDPIPVPVQVLQPECEATLYSRPVDAWWNSMVFVGATHAYWEVEEYDPNVGANVFDVTISAGPANGTNSKTHKKTSYLNIWVHSPYVPPDTASAATWSWSTGDASVNCAGVNAMLAAAYIWPQNSVIYGASKFPNSNSVAQVIGAAGGFFPPAPPGAYGWIMP